MAKKDPRTKAELLKTLADAEKKLAHDDTIIRGAIRENDEMMRANSEVRSKLFLAEKSLSNLYAERINFQGKISLLESHISALEHRLEKERARRERMEFAFDLAQEEIERLLNGALKETIDRVLTATSEIPSDERDAASALFHEISVRIKNDLFGDNPDEMDDSDDLDDDQS